MGRSNAQKLLRQQEWLARAWHPSRRAILGLAAAWAAVRPLAAGALATGAMAPDFVLPSTNGGNLRLSELVADSAVILIFYPKAFTKECTKQLRAYQAASASFAKLAARIVAVSTDDADTNLRFAHDHQLEFPLLSDVTGRVATEYGVYHSEGAMALRHVFVIAKGGLITDVVAGEEAVDVRDALAACERMQGH